MINIMNQFALAWFDFIITSALFSALVFIAVFLLSQLLNKRYASLVYLLWLLVLLRLFLPLDFALPYSVMDLLSLFNQQFNLSGSTAHDQISVIDEIAPASYTFHKTSASSFSFQLFIFLFWGISVITLSVYYMIKNINYLFLVKSAIFVQKTKIIQIKEKWRRKLKIRKNVQIITSDKDITPFSCGWFIPKIYISLSLIQNLTIEKLEFVIAHEMAHIKRSDFFWIRIESIIQIVLFFNPMVWYVIRKRNQLRELLTDTLVLSQGILHKNHYIKCLLNLSEFNLLGSCALRWAPGMSEKKSQLKQRILFLQGENQMRKMPFQIVILILLLTGWFVLPMTGYQTSDFTVKAEPVEVPSIGAAFQSPLPGHTITSGWGYRKDPLNKKVKLHKGVDLKAKTGTDVLAAGTGIIVKAKNEYQQGVSYGKYVDIRHSNGMMTRYAMLNAILVEEGQKVKAGTIIGKVGSTGRSTGPHLHFELRKDGEAVNPEMYIEF